MPTVNFEFKGTVRNLHIEELYDVSAEKNIDTGAWTIKAPSDETKKPQLLSYLNTQK